MQEFITLIMAVNYHEVGYRNVYDHDDYYLMVLILVILIITILIIATITSQSLIINH
jgi:hypothetical protein